MGPYFFGKATVRFNAAILPESSRRVAFKWCVGVCRGGAVCASPLPPARMTGLLLTCVPVPAQIL